MCIRDRLKILERNGYIDDGRGTRIILCSTGSRTVADRIINIISAKTSISNETERDALIKLWLELEKEGYIGGRATNDLLRSDITNKDVTIDKDVYKRQLSDNLNILEI